MNSIDFLLLLFVFILVGCIGILINLSMGYNQTSILKQTNYNSNCSNLSLSDTSYCLRDELSKFWFYNISNKAKYLTLEELKSQGGVCQHAADWYSDMFVGAKVYNNPNKEDNSPKFYVKEVDFLLDNQTGHILTIASNPEGYCILDQLNINCVELG
jgi:hypothetical protein